MFKRKDKNTNAVSVNLSNVLLVSLLIIMTATITFPLQVFADTPTANSSDSEIANYVCTEVLNTDDAELDDCVEQIETIELPLCEPSGPQSAEEELAAAQARYSCRTRVINGTLSADIDESNEQTLRDLRNSGGGNLRDDIEADCEGTLDPNNCGVIYYIKIFTDALSVLVGIVVVMMLVIGGIRYASAGSNPQAVASAKQHISNALLALVFYLFMFAFLQWIIPGGIL